MKEGIQNKVQDFPTEETQEKTDQYRATYYNKEG